MTDTLMKPLSLGRRHFRVGRHRGSVRGLIKQGTELPGSGVLTGWAAFGPQNEMPSFPPKHGYLLM